MRSENSSSSPGESPQLSNPWDALIKPSRTPEVVQNGDRSLRAKKNSQQGQSGGFLWKHLPFKRLSLADKDGISPLLR